MPKKHYNKSPSSPDYCYFHYILVELEEKNKHSPLQNTMDNLHTHKHELPYTLFLTVGFSNTTKIMYVVLSVK